MNKKIAIPANESGILDSHFGHSKFFDLYETSDNQVISKNTLVPPPHAPGVLPKWLVQNGVTDVITGGMGDKAFKILTHFQINVHRGAPTIESNNLVENFLNQTLELSWENCNHHPHGHEAQEHAHHYHEFHHHQNHHRQAE